ncbi:MAG: ATP-grasp domain-containing protein [Dehalococcoidales bacterium]|nr:ATP-grasp domain-containing protein [Dehalococcoidales bacterium]
MCSQVAIVYNQPINSHYNITGEEAAELGVLVAVKAVHRALLELGHSVVRVPLTLPLEQIREKLKALAIDIVFNLFEGFGDYPETEALVPQILSELGIPYTGCPATALLLAQDKGKTKAILGAAGISTPHYQLLSPATLSQFQLTYPCIVKASGEHASHGLTEESVVNDHFSLERQVTKISNFYGGRALVEEFIDGEEFSATVMGNRECIVLPISKVDYSLPAGMPRLLTFAAKWEPESLYFSGTKVVCPIKISADEQERITKVALMAFHQLGCRGYARIDLRLDKEGCVNVMEVNPNPDISPGYGAARQAKVAGMNYAQFIEKIILLAREKN